MIPKANILTLAVLLIAAQLSLTQATGAATHAIFDLSRPAGVPFPSNAFTVVATENITGLRVNLPLPDCSAQPSDCDDLNVVNQMDGFNVQARLSIPFDSAIDPASVNNDTVFLVQLTSGADDSRGRVVGVNQIVWDPRTNTLYAKSDEMLEQHTSYALVVTSGVLDPNGHPVQPSAQFRRFREMAGRYRRALEEGVRAAAHLGVAESRMVAVSVFTTQTVTAVLEKIRPQLDSNVPTKASFLLGADGSRTVFALNQIKGIAWNRPGSHAAGRHRASWHCSLFLG